MVGQGYSSWQINNNAFLSPPPPSSLGIELRGAVPPTFIPSFFWGVGGALLMYLFFKFQDRVLLSS